MRSKLIISVLLLVAAVASGQPAGDDLAPPDRPDAQTDGWMMSPTQRPADGTVTAPPAVEPITPVQGVTEVRLPDLTDRDNIGPALQLIVLLTVLSLAPAILVLCTSFTRIIIVLSLLRQALGTPTLPPNPVMIGLALVMTFCVMGPTWARVQAEAVTPYVEGNLTQSEALTAAAAPMREFMIAQIEAAGNESAVYTFQQFSGDDAIETWGDVATTTLVPAFALSELKIGFLMGFKVYLPFLVIDMVIAAVLISMGMMMLPPVLISLPFKLLLFVLVDGWHLITASLMGSFVIAPPPA